MRYVLTVFGDRPKRRGDLLHGAPRAEAAQHVELAVGELLVRRSDEILPQLRREPLGERRAHVASAAEARGELRRAADPASGPW